jgi:hypothetical protein
MPKFACRTVMPVNPQVLGHMLDRFRDLDQSQHMGASSQDRFRVAAATGSIDNERPGPSANNSRPPPRAPAVINKILHLGLLFEIQRTGREPNRPLKQQIRSYISDQITQLTNRLHSRRADKLAFSSSWAFWRCKFKFQSAHPPTGRPHLSVRFSHRSSSGKTNPCPLRSAAPCCAREWNCRKRKRDIAETPCFDSARRAHTRKFIRRHARRN